MEIKEPYGFIYITTNMINGKKYIGQKKFCEGWKRYLGSGTLLREAIKKYGKENFIRDIVAIAYSSEELNRLEIEFIKNHNADDDRNKYYNITKGGNGAGLPGELNGMYGKHHTEEVKKKISEANKGEKNSFYGRHHTEETKEKLRIANKGKWMGKDSPLSKKVICLETKEIFDCISEIGRLKKNVNPSNISACCRGEQKSAFDKTWMFLDDYKKLSEEEVNKKMIESKQGIKGTHNPKARKIVCLNTREEFELIKDASKKYGITKSLVSSCCSGTYISVTSKVLGSKLVFRYYEDYIKLSEKEINDLIMYGKYNCNHSDRIICLDTQKVYYCARQVEEETKLFATSITACCKGRYKRVGKLSWMYYEEYLKGSDKID